MDDSEDDHHSTCSLSGAKSLRQNRPNPSQFPGSSSISTARLLLVIFSLTHFPGTRNASSSSPPLLCRDKFGRSSVLDYRRRSAVMCHFYLFNEVVQGSTRMLPSVDFLALVPVEVIATIGNDSDLDIHLESRDGAASGEKDHDEYLMNARGQMDDKWIASSPKPQVRQDEMSSQRSRAAAVSVLVAAAAVAAHSGDSLDPLEERNHQFMCRRLGLRDCTRWQDCMSESVLCCQRQIKKICEKSSSSSSPSFCPMTWDGFSCWDETESETKVTQQCPEYVDATGLHVKSIKTCSVNGTWFTNSGQEWTDYTNCYDKRDHLFGAQLNIVLNIMCIIFLVLAIWLFAYFRDLMRQERIILHVHFFLSLILVSTFKIIWFALVHYDLLTTKFNKTVVDQNPVWCRLISFLMNYFKGTNFSWMFCEAYHLHRLISNAFETHGSTTLLYVIGWFFPILTTMAYAVARYFIDDFRCWSRNIGAYQWIIDAPMCLCLLLNLLFLLNILRTLLFQLQAHPNEPNAFRRGIKAGLMLVPLFGVQLLCTIYRPDLDPKFSLIYEYFSFVILNSQGIFVSLIFCFFNGEVLSYTKRSLTGWCRKKSKSQAYMTNTRGSMLDFTGQNQDEDAVRKNEGVHDEHCGEQMIPLKYLSSNGLAD